MNRFTCNIWSLNDLGIDFKSMSCWLSIWFYLLWAFEPLTWLFYVLFIQRLCISKTCLISCRDYIHITCVCMNMIRTCWNLTIVNLKNQYKACYLLMSRVKLIYLSLLCICFISLNFSHVSYSLAKD
jgi:hypothetical protein